MVDFLSGDLTPCGRLSITNKYFGLPKINIRHTRVFGEVPKSCCGHPFSAWTCVLSDQTHDDRLLCLFPWVSRHISAGPGLCLLLSRRHVGLGEEWQLRELYRGLRLLLWGRSLQKVPDLARLPSPPPRRQVLQQVSQVSFPLSSTSSLGHSPMVLGGQFLLAAENAPPPAPVTEPMGVSPRDSDIAVGHSSQTVHTSPL